MMNAKFKRTDSREFISTVVSTETNSIKLEDNEINISDIPLDNPVTGTVYGTLLNFHGALERLGDSVNDKPYLAPPVAPVLYIKPANTFNRYGAGIPVPENESHLEMGAALGIVIGKTAVGLTQETAMDYVAGYSIVNDVSVPHATFFRPAVQHKCRDGFCPIGPWIIDRDELKNPDDVTIRVYINDELKQENSTNNLIRPVARLLVDVTEFMTLSPGDVLLVGVPEDAPLATTGDKVRIEIEGVGSLENVLVDEKSFSRGWTQ
ncbi:fumarylacetoacetate hydrolase family protein [Paenisporosarcina sp. NPDC076898]|uniref:fumarylacetoacetate hydrolase family protein n=1 Tax=unclassified Paenisporosarcina TaxID=2642018 RepID=UPI003D08C3F3